MTETLLAIFHTSLWIRSRGRLYFVLSYFGLDERDVLEELIMYFLLKLLYFQLIINENYVLSYLLHIDHDCFDLTTNMTYDLTSVTTSD